ncbi:MAG: hypothetical protein JAZ06_18210 [Candidatus Thiodiazotropha taylori]|nr:hypothetical protein [Candidatus Thiodiazotropha taylori]
MSKNHEERKERDKVEQEAVREFLEIIKPVFPRDKWQIYYSLFGHGEWEMAFHWSLEVLRDLQIKISPQLKKSIDRCLLALKAERHDYPELEQLKYDEYWKKQYGYE